jgi:signal transduction histidine kinase
LLARGGLDGPTANSVARIASSGARMAEMVSLLLDLTRIRAGKGMPIQRRESDLGQLCRDVANEVAAAHPERRVICEVEGDLRGAWDVARLSQVLSNLIVNALQHGDPGAPVRVSAQPTSDGKATVAVHNEGAPIPAESLKTIFDPFRQASGKSGRGGSIGLGLFIARSIIHAHGGTIDVSSSPEAGTTFCVLLPRAFGLSTPGVQY